MPVAGVPDYVLLFTVLALVLAWATGLLHGGRISPGPGQPVPGEPSPPAQTRAERVTVALMEDAVGTVRSRRQVVVAAQTIARVVHVGPHVGDTIRTGELLVRLGYELIEELYAKRLDKKELKK